MTEVPGTDREQARKDVVEETPLAPDDIEVDDDPADAATGDGDAPVAPPPSA